MFKYLNTVLTYIQLYVIMYVEIEEKKYLQEINLDKHKHTLSDDYRFLFFISSLQIRKPEARVEYHSIGIIFMYSKNYPPQ